MPTLAKTSYAKAMTDYVILGVSFSYSNKA